MSTYPFNIPSGLGISPEISGVSFLGNNLHPFSGLYVKKVNDEIAVISKLNEKPSGSINSANTIYTTLFPPFSESTQLYKNGIYLIVSGSAYPSGFDYSVSGSTLTLVTPPSSGATLIINYNYVP